MTPHPSRPTATHPSAGDLALAYAAAAAVATAAAWIILQALHAATTTDLAGSVEPLLLLTRISVVATPLTLALRVAGYAALLWLALAAMGERPAYKGLLFRLLLLAPILEAPAAIDALAFLLRDAATLRDAHVPIGLDLLLPGHHGRLGALLSAINAATLAWGAALGWSLHRALGHSRTAAALAALLGGSLVVLLPLLAA